MSNPTITPINSDSIYTETAAPSSPSSPLSPSVPIALKALSFSTRADSFRWESTSSSDAPGTPSPTSHTSSSSSPKEASPSTPPGLLRSPTKGSSASEDMSLAFASSRRLAESNFYGSRIAELEMTDAIMENVNRQIRFLKFDAFIGSPDPFDEWSARMDRTLAKLSGQELPEERTARELREERASQAAKEVDYDLRSLGQSSETEVESNPLPTSPSSTPQERGKAIGKLLLALF